MSYSGSYLSIIIVNYRSASLTIDCISSLYKLCVSVPFEIIVVNNDSQGGDKERILHTCKDVLLVQMPYNAGFARANNAGISAAKGDTILLLNPDTFAIDDSIGQCYKQLNNSYYLAAGVQVLDEERHPQISGNFFIKKGLNHLLPIPYWGDFIRWLGYSTRSKVPNVKVSSEVEEVDWISGAFLMVKKEAIDKAGLLDEDFFLYAEEVEWCSRLRKYGRLCIFGNLKIVHLEGGVINREQNTQEKGYYNLYDKKGLQLMVSNHLRVRKQYGVFWFLFLLLNYTAGVFIFFVCSTVHQLSNLKTPFKEWVKVKAFFKNVLILWKLSPLIIRNKPHFYKMF